ncbi:MAG: polysaccharide deacetylase family protein [Armatimonadota bacterium]|jgi:peptidoglycan/xylan/chitin deacetylase (PgdA/CDA1 family)
MAKRKGGGKRKGGSCAGLLAALVIVLLFGCALFLLTTDNPGGMTGERQGRPSLPGTGNIQNRKGSPAPEPHTQKEPSPVKKEKAPAQQTHIDTASPTPSPPRPKVKVFPNEFARADHQSRRIALTFDAGADSRPAQQILDVLAAHNIRATFFLTGKWAEKNPLLVKRIAAQGNEIGNHTYAHKRLTSLRDGDIAREVEKTEQLIYESTGRSTKPLLRVPYGDRNSHVLSVLADLGYDSIYWDLDSWDSVKAGITAEEIKERVLSKVRNGSIVLMHCGSRATADALDSLLKELLDAGYQPVTVGELIGVR